MSSLTAYQALRTWFEANWLTTPRFFENEAVPLFDTPAPFVYFETRGDVFAQRSIGSAENKWREEGTANFFVCVPTGDGVQLAQGYASALVELLRGLLLPATDLRCRQISVGISGPFRDNGNYYALPLVTWWQRDTLS